MSVVSASYTDPASRPSPRRTVLVRTATGLGRTARAAVTVVQYPYVKAGALLSRVRGSLARVGGSASLFRMPWRRRTQYFEAAQLAADGGLSALARTLSDPDPEVRIRALDVICEFAPSQASALLTGVLHDPDPTVRCAGAWAAPMVTGMAIAYPLILALDDPDTRVRAAARDVLGEITGMPIQLSDEDPDDTRRAKLDELTQWWKSERLRELTDEAGVEQLEAS